MTAVKRRINFTGRKRITRDRILVKMLPTTIGSPLEATASFDLDGMNFPNEAELVLEAYQRSASMRFEAGTVASPKQIDAIKLTDVDPSSPVLFRFKVVDGDEATGKLLASAERLRPVGDDQPGGRRSLFPVMTTDLGPEVWKVVVDDAGPTLLLNCRIPSLKACLMKDAMVQGAILPAALRDVLRNIAFDSAAEEGDDDAPWHKDWLQFCREELRIIDDPSDYDNDEDRLSWVDAGVRAFCDWKRFVPRILEQPEEPAL